MPLHFVIARLAATAVAVVLLAAGPAGSALTVPVVAWGAGSALAVRRRPALLGRPAAWVLDTAIVLALVIASGDWRSSCFLLALTALVPPAAALPARRAAAWGLGFTAAYAAIALATGVGNLHTPARLDTLATHLLLPLAITAGVAFSAEALRQRARAAELAVEAERRRIGWELHDSAKQRLHAAALMLSAGERTALVDAALQEVQGAAGDMETAIAELRSPLEGRPLAQALRDRADELRPLTPARIEVAGDAPDLPPVTATHVYRIVAEAMTNAVRHAHPREVRVALRADDARLLATVDDDGVGVPEVTRPGAGGLHTMRSRAFAIGGRLTVGRGPGDRGTRVDLDLPLDQNGAA